MYENDRDRLPCRAVESLLCELWSERLRRSVSPYQDFFEAGGDSVSLIEIVAEARERGLPVRSSTALRYPTPARLAEHLTLPRDAAALAEAAARVPRLAPDPGEGALEAAGWSAADLRARPVATGAQAEPLFVVHSDSHVGVEREAASAWAAPRAVLGFSLPGGNGPIPPYRSVAEIADRLLPALRELQPTGRYRLVGFGIGAPPALELARRLRGLGAEVALLALVGPPAAPLCAPLVHRLGMLAGRFALSGGESLEHIHALLREAGWYDGEIRPEDLPRLQLAWSRLAEVVNGYIYEPYDGAALLCADSLAAHPAERAWAHAPECLDVHRFDYGLESPLALIRDPGLAETMRKAIEA